MGGNAAYKTDFHTHSLASPDGSLGLPDYRAMLGGGLDYIAITDHNTIDFAVQARKSLGEGIIVGEEVTTQDGEIIGLFLRELVPPGLPPAAAVELIHRQGGLVYVPHPFETVRSGLTAAALDTITAEVDIVEVFNGRALFQNKSPEAKRWAAAHQVPAAAASDAHGRRGWGKTYTLLDEPPTAENLSTILPRAALVEQSVGLGGALYPKLNRLRKRRRP
jgi:predicted metal-dependent phosphoesterase TrpH